MPASSEDDRRSRPCFVSVAVAGLIWNLLLVSGYDLGRLIFGIAVVAAHSPETGDVGRTVAYTGLSWLTALPARLGGAAGALGCLGLLMRQDWALAPLFLAALLLIWPLLVWLTALGFWMAFDPLGAALLLTHIVLTALLVPGLPVLALLERRHRRVT